MTNINFANINPSILSLINSALKAAEEQKVAAIAAKAAAKAAKVAKAKVSAYAKATGTTPTKVDLDDVDDLTEDDRDKIKAAKEAAETLTDAREKTEGYYTRILIRTQDDRDIHYGLDLRKDFDGRTFLREAGILTGEKSREEVMDEKVVTVYDDLTGKVAEKLENFVSAVTGRFYALYKETGDRLEIKEIKDTGREFILAVRDGLLSSKALEYDTDGVTLKVRDF